MRTGKILAVLLGALIFTGYGTVSSAKEGIIMPKLNYKTKSLPNLGSFHFAKSLKAGWNLGNTFDASDVFHANDILAHEQAWVGVVTDPRIFDALKQAGFSSVRIPVSWHNHVFGDDYTISPAWLARVKEIVDAALSRGLYVIINTHHDIAKAFIYPDSNHLETSKRFLGAIWRQLAEAFYDYDERLIMESMNEPRLTGTKLEWWLDSRDPASRDAVLSINALNQHFVNIVRAAGGGNATRYLLVPGYAASVQGCLHKAFKMPKDTAGNKNRLMLSVHAYMPYDFALQASTESGSSDVFSAKNRRNVNDITKFMNNLYERSLSLRVPIVIGEFGCRDKNGNLQARVDYTAVYTALAQARGFSCFWWDNHIFTGDGELFGLLDRQTFTFEYPQIVDALISNTK